MYLRQVIGSLYDGLGCTPRYHSQEGRSKRWSDHRAKKPHRKGDDDISVGTMWQSADFREKRSSQYTQGAPVISWQSRHQPLHGRFLGLENIVLGPLVGQP